MTSRKVPPSLGSFSNVPTVALLAAKNRTAWRGSSQASNAASGVVRIVTEAIARYRLGLAIARLQHRLQAFQAALPQGGLVLHPAGQAPPAGFAAGYEVV